MSDATTKLGLPFIMPAQAQKHVTHNEALQRLDAIVHLSIISEENAPPESPDDGTCYLVGAAPTDVFSGHAGAVAIFQDGFWQFITPVAGWSAWFASEGALRSFDGSDWITPTLASEASFSMLGVNATADTTNRLSVSSPATLLNNEGAGHQLKINKAASTDTASLLFQTGWSGRAEMGLSGSDSFTVKTSPDGANWHEALKMTPEGAVTMPQRPLVRAAYAAGATTIASAMDVGFDNLYTNQGGFTLGSAVSGGGDLLIFPVSGYYAVSLTVTASSTGTYGVTLSKNGSENSVILRGIATGGADFTHSATAITYFSAGDNARLRFAGSATYNFGYGATELVSMLV